MIDSRKTEAVGNMFRYLQDKTDDDEFSKELIASLLWKSNVTLEDNDILYLLQDLHNRGYIELRRQEAVYLKVLLRGVDIPMASLLRILLNEKIESRNDEFKKSQVTSYLRANKLDIDDVKVQAVLQKWHDEGKINLIKSDDVYLKLLI
jgi:hypothetical protein